MNALHLHDVYKTYKTGTLEVPVLRGVTMEIQKGEMVAIMGPSGSGKSTVMNLLGLLDRPTKGQVRVLGEGVTLSMSDNALAKLRSEKIGFVFQSFQLLPRLSALQNVLIPTMYNAASRDGRLERAQELLDQLGLKERAVHMPTELSGGEKQRVAIARALMNNPDIILADEPTGNLDSASGREVMDILEALHKEGKTVVIITHDPEIAKLCQRTVQIRDGKVKE